MQSITKFYFECSSFGVSFSSAIRGRTAVVVEVCEGVSTNETLTETVDWHTTRVPSPEVEVWVVEELARCGEEIVTLGAGLVHNGEIALASREMAWWRSGLRARLSSGEAGSAFLVRLKGAFGLTETARGLGDGVRVGEEDIGDGDGVLARGLSG